MAYEFSKKAEQIRIHRALTYLRILLSSKHEVHYTRVERKKIQNAKNIIQDVHDNYEVNDGK